MPYFIGKKFKLMFASNIKMRKKAEASEFGHSIIADAYLVQVFLKWWM